MQKLTASFLGRDGPGIVAEITSLVGRSGCNIEAMSQTMLKGEFAAIFVVSAPDDIDPSTLKKMLEDRLAEARIDLSVMVRPAVEAEWGENIPCEPFVVTADGPDGPGEIGALSKVFARHGVNIENLAAVLGEVAPGEALFVFEVMVPRTVDLGRLRREFMLEAKKLGLQASVQHRDIFEAVNRITAI